MEVAFYHCTRAAPLTVLPTLAEKALGAGFRVVVSAADAETAEAVDETLWTYRADSFLPHAVSSSDESDAEQPVLIGRNFHAPNGARLAISLSNGLPSADDQFERVLLLFDGSDEEATQTARRHWRALEGRDGVTRTYWQQGDRGWQKRA